MPRSTHLEFHQWVDWARGLAGPEEASAVEAHLVEGCPECERRASALRQVVESARIEGASPPPERAVCAAEDLFSADEIAQRATESG